MLEVKNLSFAYKKDHNILSDISLSVEQGEVLSILGPNGTGKTTFIKCLNRIIEPQCGEVLFDGTNLSQMKQLDIAKMMAYVPQYTNRVFPVKVVDAVLMGRLPYAKRSYSEADKEIAFVMLRKLDLEQCAFRTVNELSGGERQRVFIAAAMARQPHMIILDEPTSSLDVKNQLLILKTISDLAKQEKLAIIMTIHDLNLASMFSDKILMLKDSRIFAYGSTQAVLNKENIDVMYGVQTSVTVEDGYKHVRLLK